MELRVLRYFLAVAREHSITKAAKILHVTQPTLSRQLQDLEEELGHSLMVRNNHHFQLTPEGILLRKRAEEVMEIIGKTEKEFQELKHSGIAGDIYIGGGETAAMRSIVKVMNDVRQKFPAIRFHLYSGNAEDVMDRLDNGLLDFGLLLQPVEIEKYENIELPDKECWGLLMRKDHPLAERSSILKQDILNTPLLCSRLTIRRSGVKNAVAEWFGKDFETLTIAASYNLIFNAALMVEGGIGCAIVMDKLAAVEATNGLCFRPFQPLLETGLNIVWKKQQVFNRAAEIFLIQLRKEVASKALVFKESDD